MPDVIRETDEYVRYDMSFDDIIDAAEQVEAAAEGYTDLDTRLDGMDNAIDQAKQAIHFKGFVNYYDDLPDDAEENDAYTVLYSGTSGTDPDGTEYVYSDYEGSLSWNPWGKQTYSQSQIDAFLSAKQDTVTAGTGLAFGTGASANTLGHSNSVTAKATQGFAQIAYDAEGHITGSTAATTAQVNAINSGIDSTKVAQIETNKNNILSNVTDGFLKSYNMFPLSTASGASAGTIATVDMSLSAGTYKISWKSNRTDKSTVMTFFNGSTQVAQGGFTNSTNRQTASITLSSAIDKITLYSNDSVVISDIMLFDGSLPNDTPFQPYAMSNAELTNKTNEIGIVKIIVPITPSTANVYECITASKITLPAGKILRISASCIYQNSFATGIAIVRGTTKENSKILGISESTTNYNALSVSTVCSFGSDQDIYVFLQCNSTGTTKLVMSYDIISP